MKLNKFIDHTLLHPAATISDIKKLCKEAKKYEFFSVCVNSCHVSLAQKELKDSSVKICSVVGFPLGASCTKSKVFEAKNAINDGADEIDMVINIGWLKIKRPLLIIQDIAEVKKIVGSRILKVIIETCYLSEKEKKTACELSVKAGADYIKTSTGFGTGGATPEDVILIKKAVHGKAEIKASGGIRDFETAMKYIKLGVGRIGTSSGIKIVTGFHH